VSGWYEELKIALSRMIDHHGASFDVFYSGGFDSEILVRTLVELGANVTAHTIKFTGGENALEISQTSNLCAALGIRQVTWLHDPKEYVRSERYLEIGTRYACTQIAYITVLEYVRRTQMRPTVMGGEIYVQLRQKPSPEIRSPAEWVYVYREDEDGMTYRYAMDTGHVLVNEVFSYTPELIHAWTHCQTVQDIVHGRVPGKLSLLTSKPKIFQEIYPHPLLAQRKMHGYENLYYTHLIVQRRLRSLVLSGQTYTEPILKHGHEDILHANPIA
jgi:hypothetical protein